MRSGLNALIMDLDGTLLDSKPGILESFSSAVISVFPTVTLDISKVPVGPPIRQICKTVFPDITELELDRMAKAYRFHYDSQGCVNTHLYEGVTKVLSYFANGGMTIDVATNKPAGVTTALLSRLKIDGFFRSVVAVDSVHPPFASKADIIRHILKLHRIDVHQTVYIGDTAEDAAAAKACGVGFVWAAYGYGRLNGGEQILLTINKLAELTEFL